MEARLSSARLVLGSILGLALGELLLSYCTAMWIMGGSSQNPLKIHKICINKNMSTVVISCCVPLDLWILEEKNFRIVAAQMYEIVTRKIPQIVWAESGSYIIADLSPVYC